MYALYYYNMEMAVDMCLFHGYILTKKNQQNRITRLRDSDKRREQNPQKS